MSHQQFHVSDTNPNDTTGGGGCICSPTREPDCKPPYVIFYGNDMESPASPHVVACQACLVAGVRACSGEILAAGERNVHHTHIDYTLPSPVIPDAEVVDDEELPDI